MQYNLKIKQKPSRFLCMSLDKNVTSGAYVTQQYSNKRSFGFSFVIASINLIETATKCIMEKNIY